MAEYENSELARVTADRQTSENDHRDSRDRDQMEGALLISINRTLERRCPEIKMGAVKNGELQPNNCRGANVLLSGLEKSHRIRCGTYHEDSQGANYITKT